MWADEQTSTLSFTEACGGSGTADDGVEWTVTSDAAESIYDGTKGIHYGTSKVAVSYLQLSTSDITGNITQITVNASGASSTTAKLNVTVGGDAFGSEQSLTSSADEYTLTGNASGEIIVRVTQSSAKKALYVKSIAVTYTSDGGGGETVYTPSFDPVGGTYTSAQSVGINCETDGATIHYTMTTDGTTPDDPTESDATFSSNISVTISGTKIKAKAFKADMTPSSVASATYTILPVTHAGTAVDPFTVADARNKLTAGEIVAETDYYVTGYIAKKNSISSGQMTYWISDDGTETSTIQCYKGKYIDGASFTDSNAPAVGDLAVVKGKLTIYQSKTYEFTENNEVVSITPKPTITISKTSLSDIDYEIDNGPSDAQTFSVSGTTLTENITLSLGGSSNFEMSLTEGSGYTNSLTLTPSTGTVAATIIYVRLKEGLNLNTYNGTITLTSTGATNKTVTLTGSVLPPSFAFDLSTDNTTAATTMAMNWIGTPAVMGVAKGSAGTDTNNYYPGTSGQSYTSTRFYKNSILTIIPISGYTITRVVFEATTEGYATALQNSSWTNATAAASNTTVTITPTTGTAAISATIGGTCGFTSVKVYYTGTTGATETISLNALCTDKTNYYGTYSSSNAFVVPTDMTVSEISVIDGQLCVEDYNAGAIVPANTGVMVSSATSGDHDVFIASGGTSVLGSDNMLKPSGDAGIDDDDMAAASASGTMFYRLTMHKGTQIGFWWGAASGAAFDLDANKAYLAVPESALATAPSFFWFDNGSTGIENVNRETITNNRYYNLNGQCVANPTKGLYIVNGKKVVIK